jgi:type III restriction enzyme
MRPRARWRDEIAAHREAVLQVEGQSLVADMRGRSKSFNQFWEEADLAVIDDAFKRAARVITPDIARSYTAALALREAGQDDGDEYVEALGEARVVIAALGLLPEVQAYLDEEADKLARAWLSQFRVAIKGLSHARQEEYRQVREMSSDPQSFDLIRPDARDEATSTLENDQVKPLPTYKDHLLCSPDGTYPADLNNWERAVIAAETERNGFVCWYRNPQQPGQSSLGVAYREGDQYKIVRPDFVFFATQQDGTIVADLVDPHGYHLADALPKLRGMAEYAATQGDTYRRIEAIAEVDKKLRVLDVTRVDVRHAIAQAQDAVALYRSDLASDYL